MYIVPVITLSILSAIIHHLSFFQGIYDENGWVYYISTL